MLIRKKRLSLYLENALKVSLRAFSSLTRLFNIRILRYGSWLELSSYIKWLESEHFGNKKVNDCLRIIDRLEEKKINDIADSKSQFGQEIFVLACLNWKKNGYFIEFGAMDGISHSNTFLLERKFGWTGILAEPRIDCFSDLSKNRKCKVDNRAVWSESGKTLPFIFTKDAVGLSTLVKYKDSDLHSKARLFGETYMVNTISLFDLLMEHGAPREIDYLSLDTEGSEFDILKDFDFDAYTIKIITIEHNHNENVEKIRELLKSKGYSRVLEEFSSIEDWFVLSSIVKIDVD